MMWQRPCTEDCKKKVMESADVKRMMDDHALMMNQVQSAVNAAGTYLIHYTAFTC